MDSPIRSCVLPTVWRHVERAESTTQMMLFAKSENRWRRKKIPCQAKLIQIVTCGIATISRKPEEKERKKKTAKVRFFSWKFLLALANVMTRLTNSLGRGTNCWQMSQSRRDTRIEGAIGLRQKSWEGSNCVVKIANHNSRGRQRRYHYEKKKKTLNTIIRKFSELIVWDDWKIFCLPFHAIAVISCMRISKPFHSITQQNNWLIAIWRQGLWKFVTHMHRSFNS